MWFGHMDGFGWQGMLIGGVVMLLFWGGLITAIIWVARGAFSHSAGSTSSQVGVSARELLDQRYARGEITREQYQEMKRDLAE